MNMWLKVYSSRWVETLLPMVQSKHKLNEHKTKRW